MFLKCRRYGIIRRLLRNKENRTQMTLIFMIYADQLKQINDEMTNKKMILQNSKCKFKNVKLKQTQSRRVEIMVIRKKNKSFKSAVGTVLYEDCEGVKKQNADDADYYDIRGLDETDK